MKITDLHVNAFGVCRNLELAELAKNVTVIYGPNEAGKTTLMQFVRGILYGYQTDRTRYLGIHQVPEQGGSLEICATDKEQGQVVRLARQGARGRWTEQLRVDGPEEESLDATWLEGLLAGVDEEIFVNVFTVGLQELQELGALDGTAAAEQLYQLTTGLDRVSLAEVMQFLERSETELLGGEGASAEIPLLCKRQQQLSGELKSLSRSSRNWGRLAARKKSLEHDLVELQQELDRLRGQQRLYEISLQVYSQWDERRELQQQFEQLGPRVSTVAAGLPPDAVNQLDALNAALRSDLARIETIREQRRELEEQIDSEPHNRRLWVQAGRIEAVCEHGRWVDSLASQRESLQREVVRLEREVERQFPGAGLKLAEEGQVAAEVSPRVLRVLRSPARALKEEKQRLQEAETELAQQRREEEDAAGELRAGLAEKGVSDLEPALAEAAQKMTQLRRRMELEEQLDRLGRNREDLEIQSQELLERDLLPAWLLVALGAVFVGGFVFLFTGLLLGSLLSLSGIMGILFSVLGLGGMIAALGIKHTLEKSQLRRQETCRKQQELLVLQRTQATEERDLLDRELSGGSGAWDYRSQQAEGVLVELESLVPVDARRLAAQRRLEATTARIDQLTRAGQAADERWKGALEGLGLPTILTPQQIRRLADDSRYVSESQLQLRQRRDDLQRCENEVAELEKRVDQLFFDTGLVSGNANVQDKLRQLHNSLQQQREVYSQRQVSRRKDRQLKRKGRRLVEQLDDSKRKKSSLLSQAGVADEQEFRDIAGKRDFVVQLQTRIEQLDSQIDLQTKGRCDHSLLKEALDGNDPEALNAAWDEVQDQLERRSRDSDRFHTKLGEVGEQFKLAGQDRRLIETRFDLGCIQHQLASQVERWQTVAMTGHVLKAVREVYERERQPETLQDASEFLRKMTGGRYSRVWTPLDENILQVDDEAGNVLGLEALSRGTREAVFVCLRLALVRGYARRGMSLPLILDDVLVNCDGRRAEQAVEVLCEFAELGHQVLFFTCHQHICALFEKAGVDIRTLPDTSTEATLIAETAVTAAAVAEKVVEESKEEEDAEDAEDESEEYQEEDETEEDCELEEVDDELEEEEDERDEESEEEDEVEDDDEEEDEDLEELAA